MNMFFARLVFSMLLFCSVSAHAQYDWKWARTFTSRSVRSGLTEAWATTTDKFGNVYAAGTTARDTFSFGSYVCVNPYLSSHFYYGFLVKYDSTGAVIWAKFYDWGVEGATGMTTDSLGNLYMTGSFNTYNLIFGADTLTNALGLGPFSSAMSNFVAKISPSGTPIWAKKVDSCSFYSNITLDRAANIYLTGVFTGKYVNIGSFHLPNHDTIGTGDIYVTKMDNTGNAIWVKTAGGVDPSRTGAYGQDGSASVAVDGSGNVFITGQTSSPYFNIDTVSIFNRWYRYANMLYVAKYNAAGNFLWVRYPQDTVTRSGVYRDANNSYSVVADAWGNAYISGGFVGRSLKFDSITLINDYEETSDMFMAKYNAGGNLVWAKSYGGNFTDAGYNMVVDSLSCNIWLSGTLQSDSALFDTTMAYGVVSDGSMMCKFDTGGNVKFVITLMAGGDDQNGITVDGRGNIYLCGDYWLPFVYIGRDTMPPIYGASEDFFIARLALVRPPLLPETAAKYNAVASGLQIYPNPAKETITIKYDHAATGTLTITNMAGQIVQSQAFTGLSTISTAHYVPGIYMCRVVVDGQALVSRFRVE